MKQVVERESGGGMGMGVLRIISDVLRWSRTVLSVNTALVNIPAVNTDMHYSDQSSQIFT